MEIRFARLCLFVWPGQSSPRFSEQCAEQSDLLCRAFANKTTCLSMDKALARYNTHSRTTMDHNRHIVQERQLCPNVAEMPAGQKQEACVTEAAPL